MSKIQVLPESVANKIAAGEVVERPASIVKELVENSLDAGAKKIEVIFRHGGKSLIRVSDDGSGMSPKDAELSFQRHATSKISDLVDLDDLASFGFRGEALPSIAAVSRVKLLTSLDGKTGVEMKLEGGVLKGVEEKACRRGSIIEIKDLFFNTPARRKFLKTEKTEASHLSDMVTHISLSRLDVHFTLKDGDNILYDLLPTKRVKERAAAILGKDTLSHFVEIQHEMRGLRVRGVIGKPYVARANRSGQIYFVNGRWVKAPGFGYGLQAGYHGYLMHGQYPVCVLFVDLDPGRVDVNVHPTKREVRVSNEAQVKSLIKQIVQEALQEDGDLSPNLEPASEKRFFSKATVTLSQPVQEKSYQERVIQALEPHYPVKDAAELEESISVKGKLEVTKIMGQIHHTFIVAETKQGMMVLDQHAAHERVHFEALRAALKSKEPTRQRLLMDEVVDLNPREFDILKEHFSFLRKLGYDIDEFGDNSVVIRSVPATLAEENPTKTLKTYAEQKDAGRVKTDLEHKDEEIAALIACKRKSVKAHAAMTAESMRHLVQSLSQCENPFACPHGRPTLFKYSFLDLEKQFKRK